MTPEGRNATRSCVVCGGEYTQQRRESNVLWAKRATCGKACADTFRKAPLGTYPTPLLTCRECRNMARPQQIVEGVCVRCDGGIPGRDAVAYSLTREGRAFVARCRAGRQEAATV